MHIGFLGHTFRSHSCGYLLRWLVAGLPDGIQLSFYNPGDKCDDHLTQWFASHGQLWNMAETPVVHIVQYIIDDKVDVLIDLDSVTLYKSTAIIALLRNNSQAPPTVSWMGFAPSGLCEYAIADHAVVPQGAEVQYREKILWMSNCYLTCGGFETAVPEYRREDLGVPSDALVYFYGQKPMKTHPDTVAAIAAILKQQADAHLLLKTFTQEEGEQVWLDALNAPGRVHFLPASIAEERARANLLLADIALDSWPYNGTLTTMECLWAGIPVVTRYGQGWSSRQGLSLCESVGLPAFPSGDRMVDGSRHIAANLDCYRSVLTTGRNESALWDYRTFAGEFVGALEAIL